MTTHRIELLTVKEMQDYLKIGKTKAYELINSVGFPAYKISTTYRIPLNELNEWLDTCR
jgi:excisionase family DNA binding protein